MKTSLLILTALVVASTSSLHAANVTGKWKSEFDTPVGRLSYIYDLKEDGTQLTGKAIRTRDGQTTEIAIKEGKVNGDEVSFIEPLNVQDRQINIEYRGKLAGDEFKFTRKVGDYGTTEIVAKREPVATVAGKWQAEFDTQIGTQKYIYEFKVDGEKLTGRAIGDIAGTKSDTEIQDGKVKGANISFVENVDFQGQQIRVDYTGKLVGDELKMTRQVGDVATEELVAKRVKGTNAK